MECENGNTFFKALGNDLFVNTDVLVDMKNTSNPIMKDLISYPADLYAKYHDAVSFMQKETEQMHTKTLMWPASLTDKKYKLTQTILTRAAPYLAELKQELDKLLPTLQDKQKQIFDDIFAEMGEIEAFLVKEIVVSVLW
ncbi:hypothetical protein Y032_0047g1459 [Ancylostoma ceylanicum]|nr:hypothetical protein Y032_0047g1459 [Ancylostoma ceylanicum]